MASSRFDHPPDPARTPFRRLVLILWVVALSAVCIRVSVQKKRKVVVATHSGRVAMEDPEDLEGNWPRGSGYKTYYLAGLRWREGRPLYRRLDVARTGGDLSQRTGRDSGAWGGFRYSPSAALMFVPLTWMSPGAGEVVWRVFLLAVSLGGLYWCGRVGIPRPLARRDWAIFFLLVLPSFTGDLNNGQSSCILIGCLLGAIAAVTTERWWIAAVLVAVATLLKLYPISVGLLLVVLYPRQFGWKFALALAIGLALPFAIRPHSMMTEHRWWWWHLLNDARPPKDITSWDQDLRLLLMRYAGVKLSNGGFLIVQAAVAGGIAALCLAGQRAGWPTRLLLARMLGMATCWMTALGMATEPSTYMLIAPPLAWAMWEAWLRPAHTAARLATRGLLVGIYLLLISAYVMLWFPHGKVGNSYGPEPLAGLLLLGYIVGQSLHDLYAGWRPPHRLEPARVGTAQAAS